MTWNKKEKEKIVTQESFNHTTYNKKEKCATYGESIRVGNTS